MDRKKPSLKRILWTDYPAFFTSLLPIVAWVVILAWVPDWRSDGSIIPHEMAPLWLVMAAIVTLASLGVVAWRVLLLQMVFREGEITSGHISSVQFARDRGRVRYTFAYRGRSVEAITTLHRAGHTKNLRVGERVTLVVDRKNPRRAFIQDLYI